MTGAFWSEMWDFPDKFLVTNFEVSHIRLIINALWVSAPHPEHQPCAVGHQKGGNKTLSGQKINISNETLSGNEHVLEHNVIEPLRY